MRMIVWQNPQEYSLAILHTINLPDILDELENKKMILQSPLVITEKGRDFLQDYDRISNFVHEIGIKYLDISPDEMKGGA